MKLSPVQEKFVLHWGEWDPFGVSIAQWLRFMPCLYNLQTPERRGIAARLVARSNVSTSLRNFRAGGRKTVHVMGDKRDHLSR